MHERRPNGKYQYQTTTQISAEHRKLILELAGGESSGITYGAVIRACLEVATSSADGRRRVRRLLRARRGRAQA